MKHLLIPLCLLICSSITAARRSWLQVALSDGSNVVYCTDAGMRIQQGFDAESAKYTLSISTDDKCVTYSILDVKSMKFLPASSDFDDIKENRISPILPTFTFDGSKVTISAMNLSNITVYGVDGTKQSARVSKMDDAIIVDVSGLSAGSYIVKTNINSIKIQIR